MIKVEGADLVSKLLRFDKTLKTLILSIYMKI